MQVDLLHLVVRLRGDDAGGLVAGRGPLRWILVWRGSLHWTLVGVVVGVEAPEGLGAVPNGFTSPMGI